MTRPAAPGATTNLRPELSRRIVLALLGEGRTLRGIAADGGATVPHLKSILAGDASFRSDHLARLDDLHPGLVFRIGAEVAIAEVREFGRRTRGALRRASDGDGLAARAARGVRAGLWRFLDRAWREPDTPGATGEGPPPPATS